MSLKPQKSVAETLLQTTEPENYQKLYSLYIEQKREYESTPFGKKYRAILEYAENAQKFLANILPNVGIWPIGQKKEDIKDCKAWLDANIERYAIAYYDYKNTNLESQEFVKAMKSLSKSLENVRELARELQDLCSTASNKGSDLIKPPPGNSPPPRGGQSMISRREQHEEIPVRVTFIGIKVKWNECYSNSTVCNRVLKSLYENRSDREFVLRSLKETHEEFISQFCDSFLIVAKAMEFSPETQRYIDFQDLEDLRKKVDSLRSYLQERDVENMYMCFSNRIWPKLTEIQGIAGILP